MPAASACCASSVAWSAAPSIMLCRMAWNSSSLMSVSPNRAPVGRCRNASRGLSQRDVIQVTGWGDEDCADGPALNFHAASWAAATPRQQSGGPLLDAQQFLNGLQDSGRVLPLLQEGVNVHAGI